MKIHPTAIVEPGAEIGEGTEIGPHAVIYRFARIGPHCRIHAGAVIGDTPQDLAFREADTFVRIGARCVIREHATIHRGTKPGSETVVGDECYLMAGSHLAHNVRLGRNVILANAALLGGYVEVGDRAFISGGVVVHQFARIGRLAMLGGLSALSKDVPPFCTTAPSQLNRIAGLNVVGMRRAGLGSEERLAVKRAFSILFRSGLNVSQAVERLGAEPGSAREIADFVTASRRGICAFAGQSGVDDAD